MNPLQSRIEKSIFKSNTKDGLKVFHEVSFVLAKEFGWSYKDIIEAPTPFILGVLLELEGYKKLEESAMKKRRK